MLADPRAQVRAFRAHRRATLARLCRVNAALVRWEEYHTAAALPAEIRPTVEPPVLSWVSLQGLQQLLWEVLSEFEEAVVAWQRERRN
jgi:hypothetical protein